VNESEYQAVSKRVNIDNEDFKRSYFLVEGLTNNVAKLSALRCGSLEEESCKINGQDFGKGVVDAFKVALGDQPSKGPIQRIFKGGGLGVTIASITSEILFAVACWIFFWNLYSLLKRIIINLMVMVVFAAISPIMLATFFSNVKDPSIDSFNNKFTKKVFGTILFFPQMILLLILVSIAAGKTGEIAQGAISPKTASVINGVQVLAQGAAENDVFIGYYLPLLISFAVISFGLSGVVKFLNDENVSTAGSAVLNAGRRAFSAVTGGGAKDNMGIGYKKDENGNIVPYEIKKNLRQRISGAVQRSLPGRAVSGAFGLAVGTAGLVGAAAGLPGRLIGGVRNRFRGGSTVGTDGGAVVPNGQAGITSASGVASVINNKFPVNRNRGGKPTANQKDNSEKDNLTNYRQRVEEFFRILGPRLPDLAKNIIRGLQPSDFSNFSNLSRDKQNSVVRDLNVLGSSKLGATTAVSLLGAKGIREVLSNKDVKISPQSRRNLDKAIAKDDTKPRGVPGVGVPGGGAKNSLSINSAGGVGVSGRNATGDLGTSNTNRINITNPPRRANTSATIPQLNLSSGNAPARGDIPQDRRVLPANARSNDGSSIPIPTGLGQSRVVPNFDKSQTNYNQAIQTNDQRASLDQSLSNQSAIGALTKAGLSTGADLQRGGSSDQYQGAVATQATLNSAKHEDIPTNFTVTGQVGIPDDRVSFKQNLPTGDIQKNTSKTIFPNSLPQTTDYVGAEAVYNQPRPSQDAGSTFSNTNVQAALTNSRVDTGKNTQTQRPPIPSKAINNNTNPPEVSNIPVAPRPENTTDRSTSFSPTPNQSDKPGKLNNIVDFKRKVEPNLTPTNYNSQSGAVPVGGQSKK